MSRSANITITEYCPKIFRNIRKDLVSEQTLFKSLIPSQNFKGIHSFSTGSGRSPSFFFFAENKLILIKTLKGSEFKILMDGTFLPSYYKHIINNPNSLLSRYMGLYEIKINNQTPMFIFVTENMIGRDFNAIKRCYDIKGSSYMREVEISIQDRITGQTGLNVLKC